MSNAADRDKAAMQAEFDLQQGLARQSHGSSSVGLGFIELTVALSRFTATVIAELVKLAFRFRRIATFIVGVAAIAGLLFFLAA